MWVDRHPSGNGFIRGDSFTLLCHLRGCDPDQPAAAVVDEFLSMAVQAEVIRPEELGEVVEAERKMGQMLAEKPNPARANLENDMMSVSDIPTLEQQREPLHSLSGWSV